ncbi:MAG: outer membrane beta-barrel protein [Myxococcaceae bacterium]
MAHTTLLLTLLCAALDAPAQPPDGASSTAAALPGTDAGVTAAPAVAVGAEDGGVSSTQSQGFFSRLGNAYWEDWTNTLPSTPPAPYRGYPPPVSNPPFPWSYWPYGGSPTIGAPNDSWTPLMAAIYGGPGGDAWKESGVTIYGWLAGGFNLSSSRESGYANAPAAYYSVSNSWILDQFTLYIERDPDTVQTEHFDWGFRLANLVGLDYRYTTMKGVFSNQLLVDNNRIGYDPVMFYVDLYFPVLAGLNVRVGRYISVPDIEAQLAPDNYTYSHSLLYTYDAYTQLGVMVTLKLDDHWLFQAGFSSGNDVAFWVKNAGAQPTATFCLSYTWTEGKDNVYLCANSINTANYGYNNMNAYYATWYHQFGDGPVHMALETWYQYQLNVPSIFVPNNPALIAGANGAWCSGGQTKCFAPEWSIVDYLEVKVTEHDAFTYRIEYFDDIEGQRTGYKTQYFETMISWAHFFGTSIIMRPEIRYEHSFERPAYNNGTAQDQLVTAMDFIFKY